MKPTLTGMWQGVEVPLGAEVYHSDNDEPIVAGYCVAVNPADRAWIAVAHDKNPRRWSNTQNFGIRRKLGLHVWPSRASLHVELLRRCESDVARCRTRLDVAEEFARSARQKLVNAEAALQAAKQKTDAP